MQDVREVLEVVRLELERASRNSFLFGEPVDADSAALLLVELEGITERVRLLVGPEVAEEARERAMQSPRVADAKAAMAAPVPR